MSCKRKLKIVSLNVRGMISKNKRDKICLWLRRHKVDIACLQETHCTKQKLETFQNSWNGISKYGLTHSSHSKGVGILFGSKLNVNIENYKSLNDGRILLINFWLEKVQYTIVNCYAPNEEKERILWMNKCEPWIRENTTNSLVMI